METKVDVFELLKQQVAKEIESLEGLEPGSKERSEQVENVAKISRLLIEQKKNYDDYSDKIDRLVAEKDHFDEEMAMKKEIRKSEKYDKYIDWGIRAVELLLPLAAYGIWFKEGLIFEKENCFTSLTVKNLFGKLKPKK